LFAIFTINLKPSQAIQPMKKVIALSMFRTVTCQHYSFRGRAHHPWYDPQYFHPPTPVKIIGNSIPASRWASPDCRRHANTKALSKEP
jgi:hypothetical protein